MSIRLFRFILKSLLVLFVLAALLGQVAISQAQDSLIKQVAVVQVLGDQGGKYVAGKDAVVVVLLNSATAPDAATQSVTISRDGTQVIKLDADPTQPNNTMLTFSCPSRAACGDWKAGTYTFDVKVGEATSKLDAIKFQERAGLSVLLVPVKANYGGEIRPNTGAWKSLIDFTRQVFPVTPDKMKIKIGQEFDATDAKFDMKSEDGGSQLLQALTSLQPSKACYEDPRPADVKCYDSLTSFVKDRMGKEGTGQGLASAAVKANINVETDDDAAATVAHEIAHLYGVGDEYSPGHFRCNVNPPPAAYVGKDWDTSAETSCKDSQSEAPPMGQGSLIPATSLPFEVGGRGLLTDPMLSYMGSGAAQKLNWTTTAIWTTIFDAFDPTKKTTSLYFGPKVAVPHRATQSRWVYASGLITKDDKVTLSPFYSFMDSHEHKATTGTYTLQSVDDKGQILATDDIKVIFENEAELTMSNTGIFQESVPYPDGTAAFQILKGGKVIGEVKASANAPTVKIIAPTAGEKVSGKYTIKWEGSDKDNDKLFYTVYYTTDGEDWGVLVENTTKTELTYDFAQLWGSDKPTAQIAVEVTDGVNAADVDSEKFNVPINPPVVDIESPMANATMAASAMLTLKGSAYDPQDEEITGDEALVWTSDVQGDLGKGEFVNVKNLKVGKHVITLTAVNSFGVKGTATVTITVVDKVASAVTGPVDFTPKAGGYTVKMPAAASEASEGTSTTAFAIVKNGIYLVKYTQFSADVVAKMTEADIDKAINDAQTKDLDPGEKVSDSKKITLDTNPGLQVTVSGQNSGKARYIFIKSQGRLYTIGAVLQKSSTPPTDADTFMDSFKLVAK